MRIVVVVAQGGREQVVRMPCHLALQRILAGRAEISQAILPRCHRIGERIGRIPVEESKPFTGAHSAISVAQIDARPGLQLNVMAQHEAIGHRAIQHRAIQDRAIQHRAIQVWHDGRNRRAARAHRIRLDCAALTEEGCLLGITRGDATVAQIGEDYVERLCVHVL